jgi:hypothetical protein
MREQVHLGSCYRQSMKIFVKNQNKPFTEATLQVAQRASFVLTPHGHLMRFENALAA